MALETTRPKPAPALPAPPPRRRIEGYGLALASILAVFVAVALWNARTYPVDAGYDALHHREYVDILRTERRLPTLEDRGAFNKPPLFYFVAAGTEEVGAQLGLARPELGVQYLNVLFALAAALLVLAFVRLLWPGRRGLHVAALGFFAFVPLVLKTTAMYYPGTLALLFAAAAMFLTARLLGQDRFRPFTAVGVAAAGMLGAATLAAGLWVLAGVGVTLVAALFVASPGARKGAALALATVAALGAVAATAWVARQPDARPLAFLRGGSPSYAIPVVRGPEFLFGTGIPEVLTDPNRTVYRNEVIPTAYSELWGDDLSVWAWGEWLPERSSQQGQRAVQNWVGIVPTLLALTGWLALAALLLRGLFRERPAALVVAVVPAVGLAGLLYYAYRIPAPDGDTIKGFYVLTTAPAWAAAFGLAADGVARGRRMRVALAAALVALALVDLRFLVFGRPLDPLL